MFSNQPYQAGDDWLQSLIDAVEDALVVVNRDGTVVYLNQSALSFWGLVRQDAVGLPLRQFLPVCGDGDQRSDAWGIDSLYSAVREKRVYRWDVPRRLIAATGTCRWVIGSASPLSPAGGEVVGAVLVLREASWSKAIPSVASRAEGLQSIGLIASSAAHDLNNMLAIITCGTERIKLRSQRQEDVTTDAQRVLDAARKAAVTTRGMLAMARPGTSERTLVNLHREIEDTVELLRTVMGAATAVTVRLEASQYQVRGDASRIRNAVMNLCLNARDAMPDGGSLTISTHNPPPNVAGQLAGGQDSPFCRRIILSIRDTGAGIPDHIRAHLFEPFVSSKGPGRGTGLGMISVMECIKTHDGEISIESAAGMGTTVALAFPIVGLQQAAMG